MGGSASTARRVTGRTRAHARRRRTALVLGGGGVVGIAYHAGVLQSLSDVLGLEDDDFDVVIGTSAGSVIGAYLRSGYTPVRLVQEVLGMGTGVNPEAERAGQPSRARGMPKVLEWAGGNPVERARRAVGTGWVAARSVVRIPSPPPPMFLQRAFPAGLSTMGEAKRRLRADLPACWPNAALWLTAVDLVSGQRMVLGRDGGRRSLALPDAVLASCAIPVLYPPVGLGRRILVDGGLHSMANLDLAVNAGVDNVICSLPMGYDPACPPDLVGRLTRRPASRRFGREMADLVAAGKNLLLIRPDAEVAAAQGVNLMRRDRLEVVVRAAYEATCRYLTSSDPQMAEIKERLAA